MGERWIKKFTILVNQVFLIAHMHLWTTNATIVKEGAGYQQWDARMSTEVVKPAKAAEAVAKHIEGLILEGSLRPGERLRAERELAERLAVSRPTVREGLQLLQQQGLLTREPGSGAAVAAIGTSITDPLAKLLCSRSETTDDYLEFRQVVEGTAAELAATRANEIDLEVITRCMRRIESDHGKEDPVDEAEADADLHIAVYEAAHNVVLLHVMRALAQMLRADVFYNRDKLYSRRGVRDLLGALAGFGGVNGLQQHIELVAQNPLQAFERSDFVVDDENVVAHDSSSCPRCIRRIIVRLSLARVPTRLPSRPAEIPD